MYSCSVCPENNISIKQIFLEYLRQQCKATGGVGKRNEVLNVNPYLSRLVGYVMLDSTLAVQR